MDSLCTNKPKTIDPDQRSDAIVLQLVRQSGMRIMADWTRQGRQDSEMCGWVKIIFGSV